MFQCSSVSFGSNAKDLSRKLQAAIDSLMPGTRTKCKPIYRHLIGKTFQIDNTVDTNKTNDTQIKQVQSMKHLGIYIDNTPSWVA